MLNRLLERLRGGPAEKDEERRAPPPGKAPDWCDVFRFSFRDPASGLGGLARLAFTPGRDRVRAWFFVLEPDGSVAFLPSEMHAVPKKGVAGEKLIFRCEAPLARWSLFLQGPIAKHAPGGDRERPAKLKTDVLLAWEAFAPPFDLRAAAGPAASEVFGEGRYEQFGRLTGHLQVGAARAELAGAPCARSRRWGGSDLPSGDWANLWMTFEDGLAFSATRHAGRAAGFLLRNGRAEALAGADLGALATAEPGAGCGISLQGAKGARVSVAAEATASATLIESGGVALRGALVRGEREGKGGVGFLESFAPA